MLAIALAAAPARALADPSAEAKQHWDAASAAHKDGRFNEALMELMTAYSFDPRPEFLYAIGQVHVKLGQCPQAVLYYERFLASHPKPEAAARAEKAINICKTAPPPAEAQVRSDPAQPREELGLAASENLRKAKEAEAVTATERRKAEEARIAAERERAREKLYNRHPARKWAIIGGAVGTASLITGGVFVLSARSAQSAFDAAGCGDRVQRLGSAEIAQCRDDLDRGEQRARLGNIFVGAGAAVFATSLVMFVLDPGNVERPDATASRITVTPSSISFSTHW